MVLAARSEERLQELAQELGGSERALAVRCDVTDWEDQQRMVEQALEAFGRVDVAFANAGFGGARGFLKDTPEHWREMILTNIYGAALTIRATMQELIDRAAICSSPRASPAGGCCRDRCTRAPSTRSPRWARPRARS